MTRQRLTLPEQSVREYAHGLAFNLARERLARIDDIEKQCLRSGAQYLPSPKTVILDYLNQSYRISLPDGKVTFMSGGETVPLRDQILILHYFIQAKGTPSSGNLITYKELPDGINYYPVFAKRSTKPILDFFSSQPEQLLKIGESLGGHKAEFGDVAVTIRAFKHVPVTIVLWRGDGEFGPEGSLLFDSTITDYLTNDDVHALCENIAWKLVKLLKAGGDHSGKNRD
ncbi:MAG: hypothetical protein A2144_07445 [Chloroflexi bacterium RBG_16_50_9]|nr:MAG: hypothetical protein A2144_07445 [Chloroflexi bacterium RBG_16_50_9]